MKVVALKCGEPFPFLVFLSSLASINSDSPTDAIAIKNLSWGSWSLADGVTYDDYEDYYDSF